MPVRHFLLLASTFAVGAALLSGCGGMSSSDMKKYAQRKSAPEVEQPPPAAPPAPTTTGQSAATAVISPEPPPAPPVPQASVHAAPPQPPPAELPPQQELATSERRAQSISNLEKIGAAIKAYAAKHGKLPPQAMLDDDGNPTLSWRVAILPELGYPELYNEFRESVPWFNVRNRNLLVRMPAEYRSPERQDTKTNYLGIAGAGMALGDMGGLKLDALKDGLTSTLIVVEADDRLAQEWTQPIDFVPNAADPRDGLGAFRSDGTFGLLASGRVVLVPKGVDRTALSALFTASGGEKIDFANLLPSATAEPQAAIAVAAHVATPSVEVVTEATNPTAATPNATTEATALASGRTPPPAIYSAPSERRSDRLKTAVPGSDALSSSRSLLRDIYREDYEQSQTAAQREMFAKKLLADATKVSANAADYYEILRIARDIAVAVGDGATALAAVKLTNERFAGDEMERQLSVLQDLERHSKRIKSPASLEHSASQLLRQSFHEDRYDIAVPAHRVLLAFKRGSYSQQGSQPNASRDRQAKTELARLASERELLEAARSMYGDVRTAREALQANAADGEANELVGRYLCFVKNQWDDGLPFLARAADIKLRVLAAIDLTPGRTLDETRSLGDQYWDLAAVHKEPQRRGLRLRAATCYELSVAGVAGSLEKLQAEKRVAEVKAEYGGFALAPDSASDIR